MIQQIGFDVFETASVAATVDSADIALQIKK
jgi:hypothetical protein